MFSFYVVGVSRRYNLVQKEDKESFSEVPTGKSGSYPVFTLAPGFEQTNQTGREWSRYQPDVSVASDLYQKVRLLCWVLTGAENHEKKAKHIKATWGKRCNILLFMSSKQDDSLPTVPIPMGEGRQKLWGKTKEAFKYIYENYMDKADWFFKADDDTFAIPENARYFLSRYDTNEPMWFGCRFSMHVKGGYMSGGAGYILSKEAVKRFVTISLKNITICKADDHTGAEDAELGKCLKNVGVSAKDSRDEYGRDRFFPFHPSHHVTPGNMSKDYWYWNSQYYKSKQGEGCCSDTAISFHYVSPNDLYVLNYLVYGVKPYGIGLPHYPKGWTPPPPPDEEGTAKPWIGAKKEYEERLKSDPEFKKVEEEKERKAKEKRQKEEQEKIRKEEEDKKKHDQQRLTDEAKKKEDENNKKEEEKKKKEEENKKKEEEKQKLEEEKNEKKKEGEENKKSEENKKKEQDTKKKKGEDETEINEEERKKQDKEKKVKNEERNKEKILKEEKMTNNDKKNK
ncbi:glycoprotein-N-acetylgalactosamine 3-beta-galactosyltransferase 1-like isoform X2 [Artemia franciscana]|nr:hypothetical protein QYM36_005273 [Artemia franciscana]